MAGWRTLALPGILILVLATGVLLWSTWMPGTSASAPLPDQSATEHALSTELEADVRALAEGIGQRNMQTEGSMDASVNWIARRFDEIGYEPRRQEYTLRDARFQGDTAANVIAEVEGESVADEIVVIGAHYDTVPGSPGANDNASGVAVLLSLAEWFRERPQARTLRFVAFANEEHPFHRTSDMGSEVYALEQRQAGADITAMISMDGLGYFSDEPGSQHYPLRPIQWFYPDRGDFIGLITRTRDAPLVRRAIGAFRQEATVPSEGAALPEGIPGVAWSDHRAFWDQGYAALLVTDTLPFRDPAYHRPGDTPERLDYDRLARVSVGLRAVLTELAR